MPLCRWGGRLIDVVSDLLDVRAGCGGRVGAAAYLASGLGWMGGCCWGVGLMGGWFAILLVSIGVHCGAALLVV